MWGLATPSSLTGEFVTHVKYITCYQQEVACCQVALLMGPTGGGMHVGQSSMRGRVASISGIMSQPLCCFVFSPSLGDRSFVLFVSVCFLQDAAP
jgi:hypothetical protein